MVVLKPIAIGLTAERGGHLRRRATRAAAILATTALGLAAGSGCTAPRQTQPTVDPATLPDDRFMHYLAEMPLVTTDEAYRAMLILADGEDTCKTFEEREAKLVERGVVSRAWNLKPDHVIDVGSCAAMVCNVCRIPGGLFRSTFGRLGLGDRRYAHRELVYREMLEPGSEYQPIRGGKFVALLTKADQRMQERGLYESAPLELGTEEEAGRAAPPAPPPAEQPESP